MSARRSARLLLRWLPWVRRRHARDAALAAAEAAERAAHAEARRRIIEGAQGNVGPAWWRAQRTVPLPTVDRPLMTPAAEHRTRRNRRG